MYTYLQRLPQSACQLSKKGRQGFGLNQPEGPNPLVSNLTTSCNNSFLPLSHLPPPPHTVWGRQGGHPSSGLPPHRPHPRLSLPPSSLPRSQLSLSPASPPRPASSPSSRHPHPPTPNAASLLPHPSQGSVPPSSPTHAPSETPLHPHPRPSEASLHPHHPNQRCLPPSSPPPPALLPSSHQPHHPLARAAASPARRRGEPVVRASGAHAPPPAGWSCSSRCATYTCGRAGGADRPRSCAPRCSGCAPRAAPSPSAARPRGPEAPACA